MKIERITEDKFAVIGKDWNDLVEKANIISPMLSWEWCFSWWQAYKDLMRAELYVLIFRDHDDFLVGIAPFYSCKAREYGLPVKRIEFIGTGEPEIAETCSELLDIIALPGKETLVAEACAGYLLNDKSWDEVICSEILDVDNSVAGIMQEIVDKGNYLVNRESSGRCPVVKLPHRWDDYYDGLGKRTKKLLRYERRRVKERTNSLFVVKEGVDDIIEELGAFELLHQQRWSKEGKNGCFASKVFTGFLRAVVERFAAKSELQFSTLLIDENMAASFLLFRFKGSLFFYNSAVDIEKFGALSPGTVGLSYVIEDAIKNGYKEFHFFKGRAGSYKDRWTSESVEVVTIVIRRKCLVNYVCNIIKGVKRWRRG